MQKLSDLIEKGLTMVSGETTNAFYNAIDSTACALGAAQIALRGFPFSTRELYRDLPTETGLTDFELVLISALHHRGMPANDIVDLLRLHDK